MQKSAAVQLRIIYVICFLVTGSVCIAVTVIKISATQQGRNAFSNFSVDPFVFMQLWCWPMRTRMSTNPLRYGRLEALCLVLQDK